jgi:hypothetical protein
MTLPAVVCETNHHVWACPPCSIPLMCNGENVSKYIAGGCYLPGCNWANSILEEDVRWRLEPTQCGNRVLQRFSPGEPVMIMNGGVMIYRPIN